MKVAVCAQKELRERLKEVKPTLLISIVDKDGLSPVRAMPKELVPEPSKVLHCRFNDSIHGEEFPPTRMDVVRILEWGQANIQNSSVLLAHCWGGIARSTAAVLMLLVQHEGPEFITDCCDQLVLARPQATPNELMIEFADDILLGHTKFKGKLIKAAEAISVERGYFVKRVQQ